MEENNNLIHGRFNPETRLKIVQQIWAKKSDDDNTDIVMELLNLGHVYLCEGKEKLALDKYQSSLDTKDFVFWELMFSIDKKHLISHGYTEGYLEEILQKLKKAKADEIRFLSEPEFIELVKQELLLMCNHLNLEDGSDCVYLKNYDEVIMRWRYKHAYERYLDYRIDWELVAYGLAQSFNQNAYNPDKLILQVMGEKAVKNRGFHASTYNKFNDDLCVYFSQDGDERIKLFSEAKQFESNLIDWERDYGKALNQLISTTIGQGVSFANDIFFNKVIVPNYASSLVLVDWFWENIMFHDNERELIIGIPDRDSLYYIDNQNIVMNMQFETFIMNEYVGSQNKVSPYIYIRKNGKFERFSVLDKESKETGPKKWWRFWER